MARGIAWTEPAWRDLEQAANFIAADSTVRARQFVERIRSAAGRLEDAPRLGRPLRELPDDTVRELIIDKYRLIYRIRGDTLFVLRLVHGARQVALPPI